MVFYIAMIVIASRGLVKRTKRDCILYLIYSVGMPVFLSVFNPTVFVLFTPKTLKVLYKKPDNKKHSIGSINNVRDGDDRLYAVPTARKLMENSLSTGSSSRDVIYFNKRSGSIGYENNITRRRMMDVNKRKISELKNQVSCPAILIQKNGSTIYCNNHADLDVIHNDNNSSEA